MPPAERPRLGFIGPGTVGTALAQSFAKAGYTVTSVYGRDPDRRARAAEAIPGATAAGCAQDVVDASDLVFLTVPDDAIRAVAESVSWRSGSTAVHCSGAASIDLLETATGVGASVGAFHPLQTLASLEQAMKNLPGSAIVIEASDSTLEATLTEMARAIGGEPMLLRGSKALYHASAVLACNNLVTLLDAAAGLWTDLGLTKEEGLRALLPLVRGTVENLEAIGLPDALTGPISRGDVGTIDRNLAALEAASPETADLYVALARRTIPIAREKGTLSEETASRLLEHLDTGRRSPDPTAR